MKLTKDSWQQIAGFGAEVEMRERRRLTLGARRKTRQIIALFARIARSMRQWAVARAGHGFAAILLMAAMTAVATAQAVTTTTVQGTVYLANGQPGSGTLVVSWPSFATAGGQAIAADSL